MFPQTSMGNRKLVSKCQKNPTETPSLKGAKIRTCFPEKKWEDFIFR